MGIRSTVIKPFAKRVSGQIDREMQSSVLYQRKTMEYLVRFARNTAFGKEHRFDEIGNYKDFTKHIPLRSYEELSPFVDRIFKGESDVLWPGKPLYFVGTSGTTSGVKYIPLTKESLPYHMNTARNVIFNYAYKQGLLSIFDSKMLFLSGTPQLQEINGFKSGRLSGIINHVIPKWLQWNKIPSFKTNCITDWEEKIKAIVRESAQQKTGLITGITPWILMYMEYMVDHTKGKSVLDTLPDLKIVVHGGVNYAPYENRLQSLMGGDFHSFETYPTTEGFVGFQEGSIKQGLALNVNAGVFFEFVPISEFHAPNPTRLDLSMVEIDKEYAIIINNNAGLWGSKLGDTIRFTSIDPHRFIFTGRTEHFLSAFGEHIIAREVEKAIQEAMNQENCEVSEFTVAPQINPIDQKSPYHEWFVEFAREPEDLERFIEILDKALQDINFHYKDLVNGQIIRPLQLRRLKPGAFRRMMKVKGKLGGQNKPIRLSNNREIAGLLINEIL